MTIYSELQKINSTAGDIKDETTAQGQTVETTDEWLDVAKKIDKLKQTDEIKPVQQTLDEVITGSVKRILDNTLLYIRPHAFRACEQLKLAEFSKLNKICVYSFYGCYRLQYLILNVDHVVKLESINAFQNTMLGAKHGAIYVKDELVDTYKEAKVWSQLSDIIKPISEFTPWATPVME